MRGELDIQTTPNPLYHLCHLTTIIAPRRERGERGKIEFVSELVSD